MFGTPTAATVLAVRNDVLLRNSRRVTGAGLADAFGSFIGSLFAKVQFQA
jgi:hypothetical protein